MQTRSSLKNHTRFHSKMAQKPYPIRRQKPTRLIKKEYLPPGGGVVNLVSRASLGTRLGGGNCRVMSTTYW